MVHETTNNSSNNISSSDLQDEKINFIASLKMFEGIRMATKTARKCPVAPEKASIISSKESNDIFNENSDSYWEYLLNNYHLVESQAQTQMQTQDDEWDSSRPNGTFFGDKPRPNGRFF